MSRSCNNDPLNSCSKSTFALSLKEKGQNTQANRTEVTNRDMLPATGTYVTRKLGGMGSMIIALRCATSTRTFDHTGSQSQSSRILISLNLPSEKKGRKFITRLK